MRTFVALLRGINVGGHHKLPMAELRALLVDLGAEHVETYIRSGNAAFRHGGDAAELAEALGRAIAAERGFRPQVMVLPLEAFTDAIRGNPYPEAEADPKALHVYFLQAAPEDPDLSHLEELAAADERFRLKGRVFYLHAPRGIGRSKLAAQVERALGVPATARNWRSACAIFELAEQVRER